MYYKAEISTPFDDVNRLRRSVIDLVTKASWTNPVAVTLTFKQSNGFKTDRGVYFHRLTRTDAEKTVRHFCNQLNERVYGNAFRRHGRRCYFFGAFEWTAYGDLHYHCAIDRPDKIDPSLFECWIADCWERCSDWGNRQIDIQADSDEGWLAYCAKLRSKRDYEREIDWSNTFLPRTF